MLTVTLRCLYPGDPVPASRPRVTAGGTYIEGRYRDWRDGLAWAMTAARGRTRLQPPYDVRVLFVRSNRRRVDLDNMLKGVQDAGNGVWWADDSEIRKVTAEVRYDRKRPRTEVEVARYEERVA